MKEIDAMIKIGGKFHNQVKSFSDPITRYFGINHFYHSRVGNKGAFTSVNLHQAWMEYFVSDLLTFRVWPDLCSPCNTQRGTKLLCKSENPDLNNLLAKAVEKYSIHYSLQLVEKTDQGVDVYGFALNSSDPLQHMALIKEQGLLHFFMKRFQEKFRKMYDALDENAVDLRKLIGSSLYERKGPVTSRCDSHGAFLKKMGVELPPLLTSREREVLWWLLQLLPASEIGRRLFVSKRTVEHHVERIKDKFRASSTPELVQKAHALESVGGLRF